jgi:O-acetyl-ADP-ribose deacetylase (regulator of RNase III)
MVALALFVIFAWAVRRRVLSRQYVVAVGSAVGMFATFVIYTSALSVTSRFLGSNQAMWIGGTAVMMLPFILATIYMVHALYLGVIQKHLATVDVGGAKMRLVIGNIADLRRKERLDALLCPASTDLRMLAGIAGEMKSFGGAVIEQQAREQAPLRIGQAIVTTAGSLNAKHVIHAAMTGMDMRADMDEIESALDGALRVAKKIGARSIALPPFRSRGGKVKPADIAPVVVTALVRASRDLEEVVVVVRPGREASAFLHEFAMLDIQFPKTLQPIPTVLR